MIKLEKAPLNLKFKRLQFLEIKEIFDPVKIKKGEQKIQDTDNIELDFKHFDLKDNKNIFVINFQLSANKNRKKFVGYSIKLEMVFFFEISNSNLEKNITKNLKQISALSIAIAEIRNFLKNATQGLSLPTFVIPAINMQKLLSEKNKQFKKTPTKKVIAKKITTKKAIAKKPTTKKAIAKK